MTDDLDKLRKALANMPPPDADRRASVLAAAQENFEATQGLVSDARPIHDRPQNAGRIWTRMFDMISNSLSRPAMMAGSSLAVLIIAAVIIAPMSLKDDMVFDDQTVGGIQDLRTPTTDTEAGAGNIAPMAADPAPMAVEKSGSSDRSEVGFNDEVENQVFLETNDAAMAGRVRQQAKVGQVQSEPALGQDMLLDLSIVPSRLARQDATVMPPVNDRFPDFDRSGLTVTAENPVSTFSVDVDTTSYALWRMSVLDGYPIPPQAIRVEEMINYFDYAYPVPDNKEVPFTTSVAVTQTPWNPGTRLMQIGIQGYDVAPEDRAPMGLVFLIDTSGSMEDPMKLPLLKRSFTLLLNTLNADDTVAIVTYAGSAGTVLEPTAASERAAILNALDRLSAGGSTAGQAGLQQAYGLAETMVEDGQSARVILATDGDFITKS